MLPDFIGHENQSQHYQHHLCLCLDLSGRITTPDRFSYHTGSAFWYLIISQSAHSGTYCQISGNAFNLAFRHLFTMGRNDHYEFLTTSCFTNVPQYTRTTSCSVEIIT